jgi:hypothetical protein
MVLTPVAAGMINAAETLGVLREALQVHKGSVALSFQT